MVGERPKQNETGHNMKARQFKSCENMLVVCSTDKYTAQMTHKV